MLLVMTGALAAGLVLGGFFFGGLWWTVQKGLSAKWPALWFAASLIIRLGVVLAGFYFVASGDWRRLLACVLGFFAARLAALRITRPAGGEGSQ